MSKKSIIIFKRIYSSKSFDDIDLWLKDLRANSNPDIKVFLIGNKADLEDSRQVSKEEGMRYKNDQGLDLFMETSAKTGFNTQELFIEAAKILFEDYNKYKLKPKKSGEKLKLENDNNVNENKKKGCCK